jgi:hypothetical protein
MKQLINCHRGCCAYVQDGEELSANTTPINSFSGPSRIQRKTLLSKPAEKESFVEKKKRTYKRKVPNINHIKSSHPNLKRKIPRAKKKK